MHKSYTTAITAKNKNNEREKEQKKTMCRVPRVSIFTSSAIHQGAAYYPVAQPKYWVNSRDPIPSLWPNDLTHKEAGQFEGDVNP